MKYTHKYTTRWHDTDASRRLRASKILMYFQETGNIQCREYDIDLDRLRDEHGVGFILSSISIKILRPISAFEEIEVSTWCRKARGFSFYRYFDIRVGGEIVAYASSVWALVDVEKKTLVRAPEDFAPHFPYDEPISPDSLPPRARVARDALLEVVGERKILYSDIDYNNHMNNTNYPDMLCDYVPNMQGKFVSEISLSYLKEAAFGATLAVYRGENPDGAFVFKTENSAGDTCLEAVLKIEEIV